MSCIYVRVLFEVRGFSVFDSVRVCTHSACVYACVLRVCTSVCLLCGACVYACVFARACVCVCACMCVSLNEKKTYLYIVYIEYTLKRNIHRCPHLLLRLQNDHLIGMFMHVCMPV